MKNVNTLSSGYVLEIQGLSCIVEQSLSLLSREHISSQRPGSIWSGFQHPGMLDRTLRLR